MDMLNEEENFGSYVSPNYETLKRKVENTPGAILLTTGKHTIIDGEGNTVKEIEDTESYVPKDYTAAIRHAQKQLKNLVATSNRKTRRDPQYQAKVEFWKGYIYDMEDYMILQSIEMKEQIVKTQTVSET